MGFELQAKVLNGGMKPSELLNYLELHIKMYGDNSICFLNKDGESNEVEFNHSSGKDGALFITLL